MGAKVFLSGLHYLEICLYIVKAPSAFWSPERDYFLQLKDFPTLRCGLCNLVSPRLEEGIHAGTRRLSGSLTLESAILLFQPRMLSFGSRRGVQHFGIQGCLVRGTISSALRTSLSLQGYLAFACSGPRTSLDQPYDLYSRG